MYSGGYSNVFKSASADNLSQLDDGDSSKHNKVKRLSLETNRRRRELAVRLKKEAEKEEKRKQEILEQRREKQRQATERFQRCFSARSRRSPVGFRSRSPSRSSGSELDAMLQMIRGSGSPLQRVSSWDSVRHHAWSAAADAADPWRRPDAEVVGNSNNNNNNIAKSVFQHHLEERQTRLAREQSRQLAAFSKVVDTFIEPEPTPIDSLEAWPGPEPPDEEPELAPEPPKPPVVTTRPVPSAIPVPKARTHPPTHYRFVVDDIVTQLPPEEEKTKEKEKKVEKKEKEEEDEQEKEELESVTSVSSGGVKSILKRKSVYSPPGHRSAGQAAVRDSLEVARGHRLVRSHSDDHLATEEPEGQRRRKSVRFAARLTEDLTSPRRETEPPSPKPRRVFSAHPGRPPPHPTAHAAPQAMARVAGKPPQHPGGTPVRIASRPERITSAALAKVASNGAAGLRLRVPSATEDEELKEGPQEQKQQEQQQEQQQKLQQLEEQRQQQEQRQLQEEQERQEQLQRQKQQNEFQQQQQQQLQQRQQQQLRQHQQQLQMQQQQQQQQQQLRTVTVIPGSQPRFSASEPFTNGLPPPGPDHRLPNGQLTDSLESYPVDKTPTESDIEWLWAKVRSCLHRPEPSGPGSASGSIGGDTNSELSIQSAPARAVAPMSSQLIDGTSILGLGRARLRNGRPGEMRAVHHSISPHARRLALLRQREMNQQMQRAEVVESLATTESMAEFLENEALCQQSALFNNTAPAALPNRLNAAIAPQDVGGIAQARPPSGTNARRRVVLREQHRPPSLQNYSPGSYLAPHPPPTRKGSAGPSGGKRPQLNNGYRPMSSLSIEEQRLMKSLERINDKLKTTGLSK